MRVVLCTIPTDKAESIAKAVVESKHCACVNVVGDIKSYYWWEGKIEEDRECLLIIKTNLKNLKLLFELIKEIHPYDVPEIIALPIEEGNQDYLDWINKVTK